MDLVNKITKLLTVMVVVLCSGCVSNSGGFYQASSTSPDSEQTPGQAVGSDSHPLDNSQKENLMQKAKNYPGLMKFYKTQLSAHDSFTTRLKLAHAYYNAGNIGSALFQLKDLSRHHLPSAEVQYLTAQCLLAQNQMTDAFKHVSTAISLAPKEAKIYNLQGIVAAKLGDMKMARNAFNQARQLMFDDATVLNNLAMLDIHEHQYQAAVERLLPLFRNGQADEKIRANLLFALAKSEQKELFEEVYGRGHQQQMNTVYSQLLLSRTGDSKPSTPSQS